MDLRQWQEEEQVQVRRQTDRKRAAQGLLNEVIAIERWPKAPH